MFRLTQKQEVEYISEVSIQSRFRKAVTELQIAGLLWMPSKRRPILCKELPLDFWLPDIREIENFPKRRLHKR